MQVAIFQFLANTATSRKVIHFVIRWKDIRFIMVVTVANKTHWLAIIIFSPKSLRKNNRNITTYLMVRNGYVLSVPLLNIAVKRNSVPNASNFNRKPIEHKGCTYEK